MRKSRRKFTKVTGIFATVAAYHSAAVRGLCVVVISKVRLDLQHL